MAQVYGTPYSQAAWEKLPKAKRGFKSYNRYRQWWQSNVAPKFTVSDDPFAPIPFGAQKAIATQTIQSQINPLIQSFQDAISRRGREGAASINQATNTFAGAVQPFAQNLGSVYDTSIEGMKGINQALVEQARSQGQDVSGLLAGMIPEKDAAGAVGAAGTLAQGIAGERMAQGSASLGQLYGARAADVAYGQKLPGYARGFGAQTLRDFQRQLNTEQSEGLSELRSRIPGLVTSTLDQLRKEELDKAIARKGFEMDETKLAADVAAASAPGSQAWRSGPSSKKYVADPATGELYENPNYAKPGSKPGKMNTTGITQTRNAAAKLHQDMLAQFQTQTGGLSIPNPKYDVSTPAGRRARNELVARTREKARAAVIGNLRAYYPNQPEKWLNQQAAAILYATGWPRAAADLMGVDYKGAAPAGVQTLAAPAGAPKPSPQGTLIEDQRGGKPTAPTPTPQQPNATPQRPGYLNPDRQDQVDAKKADRDAELERSYEAEARVDRAYQGAWNEARRLVTMGNVTRREARRQVVAALQRTLPRYPHKKLIAMADKIMRDAYGNTLYGLR